MDALEKRLKKLESTKGRNKASAPEDQSKVEKKPKKAKEQKRLKEKNRKDEKGISETTQDQPQVKRRGVLWELMMIGLKIAGILLVLAVLFTFVFGITRDTDISMYPSVKDGDIIVYYRLDKSFVKDDTIVVKYNGETHSRRVMAIEGDTVDINEEGLFINGSLQVEEDIHEDTLPYEAGVRFPLTVGKGEVFVLGDGRENATDSRVYGCVDVKDSLGKVMMVIRTRGI